MDQTSQENAHYQSSSIGPNKGTKVGHILFMKNHLINHQSLNFNTVFQGQPQMVKFGNWFRIQTMSSNLNIFYLETQTNLCSIFKSILSTIKFILTKF